MTDFIASRRAEPRINELIAFEAAARLCSFTRAATALALTQGAVSRAIASLEQRLEVPLFDRVRQRIVLTETGRAYYEDVRTILAQMHAATRRAMGGAPGEEILDLAVLPTFGTAWLIPRLPSFQALHPQVTLNIEARLRPFPLVEGGFDAAIHHGQPVWPAAIARHLMDERMLPMCSPAYRSQRAIEQPADLSRARLIHQSTRPSAWAQWFEEAGLPTHAAHRGPSYDQFGMAAAAAAVGLGVALLPQFLVERNLRESTLEVLFDLPVSAGTAYYLILPESGAKDIAISFGAWIATQLTDAS